MEKVARKSVVCAFARYSSAVAAMQKMSGGAIREFALRQKLAGTGLLESIKAYV